VEGVRKKVQAILQPDLSFLRMFDPEYILENYKQGRGTQGRVSLYRRLGRHCRLLTPMALGKRV
jgi:hypothetical protein